MYTTKLASAKFHKNVLSKDYRTKGVDLDDNESPRLFVNLAIYQFRFYLFKC